MTELRPQQVDELKRVLALAVRIADTIQMDVDNHEAPLNDTWWLRESPGETIYEASIRFLEDVKSVEAML